ncbi:MAG: hypothetical protein A2293_08350 [Elusimicrobia bacterium RIFOXYB2_FULL_49_7]|nr:MAG: hypothetical protein A2293_08350 [Elusimicrobia bacterium RIFOXYB2_FULL_49_7]
MDGPVEDIHLAHAAEFFLKQIAHHNDALDLSLIRRAFEFAANAHKNQYRQSGEPFQVHAVEVAKILAELRMDTFTVCAGLLHDVLEDTTVTHGILSAEFNETIAELVEGVTKISHIPLKNTEEVQIETYRKMLVSTAKDVRVIIIKLADRLHNLRTIRYLNAAKIDRIAHESLNVYVPLAHRLGMAKMRWEMEDIIFKHLHPADYERLLNKVVETRSDREKEIEHVRALLTDLVHKNNITARIVGRPKHLYSIFKKMSSGKSFEDIYDLFAIRIVTEEVLDCYKILGIVHTTWIPLQHRFKDYIATPKSNMYQSLHTAVIGPQGRTLEVQMRTEEMDRIAEEGVAAHWVYKEETGHSERVKWLKELSDLPRDLTNHDQFMEFFKIDLFQSEIFVFTPKGDLIQLPKGSTVLDFSFALHTDLGYQCVAGKIDGKAYPINTVLKSGVTIEIIKAKFQTPSPSWLNWVKTSKAKRDIRYWLKQKSFQHTVALGKELFEREVMKLHIEENITEKLQRLFPHYKMEDMDQFYHAMGNGDIPILTVLDRLFPEKHLFKSKNPSFLRKLVTRKRKSASQSGLVLNSTEGLPIYFGKCCQPLPGDKITGYLIKSKGVEIHRNTCTSGMMLMEKDSQQVHIGWDPSVALNYKIKLQVIAYSGRYLLSDITRAFSDTLTTILHAHVKQIGTLAYHTFLVELSNRHHLNKVVRELRRIREIRKISREMIFKEDVYED